MNINTPQFVDLYLYANNSLSFVAKPTVINIPYGGFTIEQVTTADIANSLLPDLTDEHRNKLPAMSDQDIANLIYSKTGEFYDSIAIVPSEFRDKIKKICNVVHPMLYNSDSDCEKACEIMNTVITSFAVALYEHSFTEAII